MHLRNGKALKEMARPTNSGNFASSQSSQSSSQAQSTQASAPIVDANVPTSMGATMTMSVSIEMGVIAPATVSTIAAAMIQPKMRTYVPPFTTNIHVSTTILMSPHLQVRARLDDRFIAMENFITINKHQIDFFCIVTTKESLNYLMSKSFLF